MPHGAPMVGNHPRTVTDSEHEDFAGTVGVFLESEFGPGDTDSPPGDVGLNHSNVGLS